MTVACSVEVPIKNTEYISSTTGVFLIKIEIYVAAITVLSLPDIKHRSLKTFGVSFDQGGNIEQFICDVFS